MQGNAVHSNPYFGKNIVSSLSKRCSNGLNTQDDNTRAQRLGPI